jgi:hypothetical protein
MKLDTLYDDTCEDMLNAGANVVAGKLKKTKFGKYVKIRKPTKNKFGWFAQVLFKGTTRTGAPAGLAAAVYEYGRQGNNPQPARPEIRSTVQSAERETVDTMERVLEEALKKT